MDPSGKAIDPIAGHLHNLMTCATPLFFNTLYDPYREGADFVRGYPFSLRDGVPTVVSHGLWLNRIGELSAACVHAICLRACEICVRARGSRAQWPEVLLLAEADART